MHVDNPVGVRVVLWLAFACDTVTNIPNDSKSLCRLRSHLYRDCRRHDQYVGPKIRNCEFTE